MLLANWNNFGMSHLSLNFPIHYVSLDSHHFFYAFSAYTMPISHPSSTVYQSALFGEQYVQPYSFPY
jgi:hypothetical protein